MLRPEVAIARRQRRNLSLPEVMLWQRLRGSPGGLRFRRQHPVGPYVVDFYCAKGGLVIEVDGSGHDRGDRPARDARRDAYLAGNGYRIIRIAAARVLADVQAVADAIFALAANPLHRPADGPPPRAGED